MTTDQLKKQIKKLPAKPGIYIFKGPAPRPLQQVQGRQAGQVSKPLYIGKALNLKNRLNSYLKTDNPRLQQMILGAKKIDFIKTDSDIEALILESQYIKKYGPDFNIMLRDDKQYFYVGFSVETFPKIFLTHQPFNSTEFIGPFTDGLAIKTTLRLLRKIFPYCTCKQTHYNYCLNYHIEKCLGFCCLKQQNPNLKFKNQNAKLYGKNIKAIKYILSGKKSSLIKNLEKEMRMLGKKGEYEKALEFQYKIEKLKKVFKNAQIIQRQTTINNVGILEKLEDILKLPKMPNRIEAYDIANIQGKHAVGAMTVFTNGEPDKNQYRKFKISNVSTCDVDTLTSKVKIGDTGMLKEILIRRFNHPEWPMPDLILIDGGKGQLNAAISSAPKNINIISLAKNKKHLGEKIYTKNGYESISLSKLPTTIKNLLLHIDTEAHRFAISYYRNLHRKSLH